MLIKSSRIERKAGVIIARSALGSIIPIHHPVLNGFGDMGGADVFLRSQVGDGAGDLEDAVVGAGAETEFGHRRLQELLGIGANGAEFLYLPRPHLGVGVDFPPLEAEELPLPSASHPFPDALRALPFRPGDDVLELDLGDIDLDVDPVEKRPGDLGVIFLSLRVRAIILPPRQSSEHAFAGLCCQVAV